jgi:hypothetical protein
MSKNLAEDQIEDLLKALQTRFAKYKDRHKSLEWDQVLARLESKPKKLISLHKMEETGGEPDVIGYDEKKDEFIFCDCSPESPKGRRSVCYDHEALESRKEHKPDDSAVQMAEDMGIKLLNEEEYRSFQELGPFDTKTSSWIETPASVRKLGGAIFGDYRFGRVFIYHNGAESYYGARGFRGTLRV